MKWSGISSYFDRFWLAETAFTGLYLRVSRPQTAFNGVFGVSIFSHDRLTSAGAIKKAVIMHCVNLSEGKFPII